MIRRSPTSGFILKEKVNEFDDVIELENKSFNGCSVLRQIS